MDMATVSSLLRTGFSILSSLFVVVIFCIVKFNDLKHIDAKLEKLSDKYDEQNKSLTNLSSQVSNIEGYIKGIQGK